MSVRQSLLAILAQGPCYGYQLRSEFERRTGSSTSLNVGQIYSTLERLERDGFVSRGEVDKDGHTYWEITDAGRAEAAAWLASPVSRSLGTRDELAIKLALAATLPGVDVIDLIRAQRRTSMAHLESLRRATFRGDTGGGPEELAWALVTESTVFAAEAEVRWLDHVEDQLIAHPARTMALEIETRRPKRGRPVSSRPAPVAP
ncbi:PadR family transcriptional regulator [Microbacterium schleiferi]|uniref:PadR family transcriptional regulator n=1 Tax=Microbacterium schleiferi TaxID=69362 RepID=A0A7S8RHR3_9MICO|nr:PadR family transcriptional regulator [Microbacterium schleiferi]QPE04667.1 PadR family transcriptional regulator [Microbacterium schleiferi]